MTIKEFGKTIYSDLMDMIEYSLTLGNNNSEEAEVKIALMDVGERCDRMSQKIRESFVKERRMK